MSKFLTSALVLGLGLSFATPAQASPGFHKRPGAVVSVQLTPVERDILQSKRLELARYKQRALRDGRLSRAERQNIQRMERSLERTTARLAGNRVSW